MRNESIKFISFTSYRRGGRKKNLLHRIPSAFLWVALLMSLLTSGVCHSSAVKLLDEVGREVIVPFPPRRIVSLAPNITETLFSLGLDEEIVGVSINCNFPERAKQKVRVGSYINLDFERIISLKP